MPYSYDPIFAADPNNPSTVASNAAITIFNPSDAGKAPITITDVTGSPLPNPITVNRNGFGPAFQHPTLDRVGWHGGGFTGYFTSYEGMKAEAVSARSAAQEAAANAGTAAAADLAARVAAGQFKGEKGADGKDGLNGSNVLPTQQAIEQAITNDGPAKTKLDTTYGRKSAANVDAHSRSKNMPNGAVTAMSETGQAARTFGNGSSWVVAGGLVTATHTAANNGAAYWQTQIPGNEKVRRIFAVVNAPADTGASLAFVLPATEWRAGGTGPLGPAGIHYVIDPNGNWHVGYWTGSGEDTYTSGTVGAWKDGTDKYVEITIDTTASSCTITHPDGTQTTVTDARITPNISGWGIIESYVFSGTAPSFTVKDFGLSAKAPSAAEPFVGKADYLSGIAGLKTVAMSSDVDGSYVAGTTAAVVAAGVTQITFNAPPSGKALLEVESYVKVTDAAAHYLQGLSVVTGSTTTVTGTGMRRVSIGLRDGNLVTRFLLTGMTPGKVAILGLRHMSTVAASATLRTAGTNAYPFNMSVTPIG